jgi:cellulose biosynthesis protein BcsQ
VERESGNRALAFSLSWLERPGNLSAEKLRRLTGRYSSKWQEELDVFLSEEERKSRINALVGIRNDVAHGKNQGVSRKQAHDYYDLAQEMVEWFLKRFDPL